MFCVCAIALKRRLFMAIPSCPSITPLHNIGIEVGDSLDVVVLGDVHGGANDVFGDRVGHMDGKPIPLGVFTLKAVLRDKVQERALWHSFPARKLSHTDESLR